MASLNRSTCSSGISGQRVSILGVWCPWPNQASFPPGCEGGGSIGGVLEALPGGSADASWINRTNQLVSMTDLSPGCSSCSGVLS